jgi:hypothetical protein
MTSQLLSYKYPFINPTLTGNAEQWVQTTPSNASTNTSFTSNGNSDLIFNFASNSQFLRTHQCFLTFDMTVRDAAGAPLTGAALTATRNSYQGVSAAFSRVTVRSGATVIESFEYADQLGLYLATIQPNKQRWLSLTEGYSKTDLFAGGATRKFCMQIFTSLFAQNNSALPLPVFPGGIELVFTLAPSTSLFTTNVPQFTIQNPYVRWCAILPDPSWTLAITGAVAAGRSLWLPLSELRTYRTAGLNTNNMLINCPVGSYSSVDSVTTAFYDMNTYNTLANDKMLRWFDAGLRTWTITAADVTNPSTRTFNHNGPNDPETALITFLSDTGSIHTLDSTVYIMDNYYTNSFRFGLNYTSDNEGNFGSGMSLVGAANTNIVIETTHVNPVPPTTVAYSTVTCSVLLEISGTLLTIHRVF